MYKKPIVSIDFINIKLINITNCDKKNNFAGRL